MIAEMLNKEVSSLFKRSAENYDFVKVKNDLTYNDFLSDKMLIIVAIRAGIPYSFFDLIQHYAPFSENDWAEFLDISTKSLQRYKQSSKHFKSIFLT